MRRVQFYGLQGLSRFSSITDEQIDGIITQLESHICAAIFVPLVTMSPEEG